MSNGTSLRQTQRDQFLQSCQASSIIGDYTLSALKQDASFRCYFRLSDSQSMRNFILMDAPPEHEDIAPFITVAKHLEALKQCVPYIHKHDTTNGFILLEDFGHNTFTNILANDITQELKLYQLATHSLMNIHAQNLATNIALPNYDADLLIKESMLFVDWFYPHICDKALSDNQKSSFAQTMRDIYQTMATVQASLVLRDFHIDNLMIVNEKLLNKDGAIEYQQSHLCGLLDFQDAVIGPISYDLVSLLEDARRMVSKDVIDSCLHEYMTNYLGNDPKTHTDFLESYSSWGLQRHAKVLGIFCRLHKRDNKDTYLKHLPHVHALFLNQLNKPEMQLIFSPLQQWLDANFPEIFSIKW